MNQASVGFHCPECTKAGSQKVLRAGDLLGEDRATRLLIAINIAVFLFDAASGGDVARGGGRLAVDGVLFGPSIDAQGEWWRIVTAGFLHHGALHLAMNMYVLWILGPQIESRLGVKWFLAVYMVSLVAGSAGALVLDPMAATAGASGAIYGLFGFALVWQRARGMDIWSSPLAMILGVNLLITFSVPAISIGGHVGGLVGGAVVGQVFTEIAVGKRLDNQGFAAALGIGAVCVVVALWAAAQWPSHV